jgi:hypothetical protein
MPLTWRRRLSKRIHFNADATKKSVRMQTYRSAHMTSGSIRGTTREKNPGPRSTQQ